VDPQASTSSGIEDGTTRGVAVLRRRQDEEETKEDSAAGRGIIMMLK